MARNPNRMQEATDLLMQKFKQAASVVVTVNTGTESITGIVATVGRTPFDVMQGEVMTAYESRWYAIQASDLVVGGVQRIPASGWRMTEANGRVYEVSVPKGLNLFERIGPNGTVFKIHTKAVV